MDNNPDYIQQEQVNKQLEDYREIRRKKFEQQRKLAAAAKQVEEHKELE